MNSIECLDFSEAARAGQESARRSKTTRDRQEEESPSQSGQSGTKALVGLQKKNCRFMLNV